MKTRTTGRVLPHRAFSLVEIVLAVGIISLALVAIFGLFGQALKSNTETISQHEVIGMSRSLSDFLRSTNGGAGFTNTFAWLKDPAAQPQIYGFMQANGSFTNALGTSPSLAQAAATRSGRLFRFVLELSPNLPSLTNLPATVAELTNAAALPVQAKVYALSAPGAPTNSLQPVFVYDTAVFR